MNTSPFLPKKETLKTPRLVLHPLYDENLRDCVEILMNDEVKKTYMLPDFETVMDAGAFFTKLQLLSLNKEHYFYGISYFDELVGFINDVEIKDDTIELGYVINPKHHNRGFATEALRCMIGEMYRIGFRCVKCGYFQGNEASRRVMEKSGMKKMDYEDEIEYRGQLRHCLYYMIENPFAGLDG